MKLIDKINDKKSELYDHLTVRTTNILLTLGINTIEQLSQADDIELLKTPGFGKKNLTECMDLIERTYKK